MLFNAYKAKVKKSIRKKIKVLRSDSGGESFPNKFNLFYEQHSIIHECSAPRTLEQNGLVERNNRTYLEMINVILLHAKLSYNLWG